jgi:hypothetical protein
VFAKPQPRPQTKTAQRRNARPFFVEPHDSARERAAHWLTARPKGGLPAATVGANANHGIVDDSTSAALESVLAQPGSSIPTFARNWAENSGITGGGSAVVHRDPTTDSVAARLGTKAFTVGHHVFMSSASGDLNSAAGGQTLQHELVHVGQNHDRPSVYARIINREGPWADVNTLHQQDWHARDQVDSQVLNAEPLDAEAYARELNINNSPAETLAYLERLLRVLNGLKNLSEKQALSARRFQKAVFERFPQSSMRRPQAPLSNSNNSNEGKKKDRQSGSAMGVVQQAKLTASEREYAEGNGFFTIEEMSMYKMTEKVKALGVEQKAKYTPPEGADDVQKEALAAEHKSAQLTLMKTVMEEELAILFPSEADPVGFWFRQHQVDAKFLGVKIGPSTDSKFGGVHKTFAERLAQVETDLQSQLGCRSAKECGTLLGVEKIGGLRGPKSATGGTLPSMHVYGLAIDINGSDNPMFIDSKETEGFRKENKRRKKRGEREWIFSNEVIAMANAAQLIDGDRRSLNSIDRSAMPVEEIMKLIRHYSDILRQYFALLDNRGELERLVALNGNGKTVDEWEHIIWSDYELAHWSDLLVVPPATEAKKGEPPPPPPPEPYVPNFINLREEMIVAMEARGILWGGRHGTPDIMHFDLRGEDFKKRRDQHDG